MGMVLGMTTLGDDNIRRVLADPPLVWKVVAPDDPEIYEEARSDEGSDGTGVDLAFEEAEMVSLDLDKAWHGLHFLLTGSAWEGEPPLNFLVAGGTPIGDLEVGYGPARALTSTEVATAHQALQALSDDTLRARFDPDALMRADIYPGIWDRKREDDDVLGYLMENLAELRSFLAQATEAHMGAIVSIT